MKKTIDIKTGDITENVLSVITSEWQSASIIACQIVLPPDAVNRRTLNRKMIDGSGRDRGSKTDLVHQRLKNLFQKGAIEKRKIDGWRNEYRLSQPKESK